MIPGPESMRLAVDLSDDPPDSTSSLRPLSAFLLSDKREINYTNHGNTCVCIYKYVKRYMKAMIRKLRNQNKIPTPKIRWKNKLTIKDMYLYYENIA